MTKEDIQELYTLQSALYHLLFFKILRYDQSVRKYLMKTLVLRDHMKILDAGSGSGLITKIVAEKSNRQNIALQIHAFDFTKSMLDRLRFWIIKNKNRNITTRIADVRNLRTLPQNWNTYDLVLTSAMLEYLNTKDIIIGLHNIKKLMKKNGKIIIFISKKNIITHYLIKKWWKANTYTQKEISALLRQIGFRKIQFKSYLFPYIYINAGMHIIEAKR